MSERHEEGEDFKYPQVLKAVAETPWAMIPERFAVIREIVAARARGERFSDEEIEARISGGSGRRQPTTAASIQIIPVYGVIVPRATLFTKMSGGTALTDLKDSIEAAVNDPQIDGILLDFDTPGGSTDFVMETAAVIRQARQSKPVWGIANATAASAGYWLLSQCSEVIVTPSGQVGSIGVFAAHEDISQQLEQDGVKVTLVRAGKYKADTNPFEPLSDEAKAALQERVQEMYGSFVRDVARGRGVSVDAVRDGFGEGRVVTARNALAEKMVDAIEPFDATVARMMRAVAGGGGGASAETPDPALSADDDPVAAASGLSFAGEAAALHRSSAALVARLTSLAEVERGRLTAAKREALTACPGALRAAADRIDAVLAETDPGKQARADEAVRERARYERLRASTTTR